MNEEVRGTLKARARMMGALRRTLEERGFLEVGPSVMATLCWLKAFARQLCATHGC